MLVGEILVGGDEYFKACCFRRTQKIAISQLVPSAGASLGYGVAVDQIASQRARCSVVEEDKHLGTVRDRFGAVRGEFENCLYLLPGDAEFFDDFINAHIL